MMGVRRGALAVVGDVNYVDHGGMVVFQDGSAELVEPSEDEDGPVTVYGFDLDRVETPSTEWFGKHLAKVAKSAGTSEADLAAALNSDNPVRRALAYSDIIGYFGPHEFDSDPQVLTRSEAKKHYAPIDRALARRKKGT